MLTQLSQLPLSRLCHCFRDHLLCPILHVLVPGLVRLSPTFTHPYAHPSFSLSLPSHPCSTTTYPLDLSSLLSSHILWYYDNVGHFIHPSYSLILYAFNYVALKHFYCFRKCGGQGYVRDWLVLVQNFHLFHLQESGFEIPQATVDLNVWTLIPRTKKENKRYWEREKEYPIDKN